MLEPVERTVLLEVLVDAQELGFAGPGDPRVQLEHALGLARALMPERNSFLDLGSGAGLPGLALAVCWPACHACFLDGSARRCAALERAIHRLGIEHRSTVLHGRAEELGRDPVWRETQPLVVARAFGPPAVAAECGSPFVELGGLLVVTEPPLDIEGVGLRWPEEGLSSIGLEFHERRSFDRGSMVLLRKTAALDPQWPRRNGVPAKRPLWP